MSPKMKINEDQTDKQLISLIKTLLETRKGEEYDGITAARYPRITGKPGRISAQSYTHERKDKTP